MASTSGPSGSENPTDNLKKEPSKGILKPSVSYEEKEKQKKVANKSAKWDEMNILKTLHPPDKDYGHMKVDEPKTPYEREINEDDDEMDGGVNAEELRKKIEEGGRRRSSSFQSEEEPDSEDESPEDKITREVFEKKRKQHYNEFQTAKILAKQMMDEDEDEDEDDDNNKQNEASLV
ncbi:protein phosphatase inhibitor 2-like [Rhopalosiphum maidis]|uniref:protein phosphatase inhibitor 2-like n=1 Tax=Rhopalosiphum maidis TaxID=43146 RepID=UPI000EFFD758|nr:protein phosphatase inhibitor 2-like [Rhopalosiphum maidis]